MKSTVSPRPQPLETIGNATPFDPSASARSDAYALSPPSSPAATSPRRELLTPSPLRAAYVEQRDQLFFRFGMKSENVRQQFDKTIRSLNTITFTSWGSTESTPLPTQLGEPLQVDAVVKFVIPHVPSAVVQSHSITFYKLLTQSHHFVSLIRDFYWFFFLEFYLLAETETRFDKYRLELVEALKAEEPATHRTKRSGGADVTHAAGGSVAKGSSNAALDGHLAQLNTAHPLWQQRLSKQAKALHIEKKKAAKKLPPKPIDELLVDDDDDDDPASTMTSAMMCKPPSIPMPTQATAGAGGAPRLALQAAQQQEKRKRDFMKKLSRRQLTLLPSHVLSNQQAFAFRYAKEEQHRRAISPKSRRAGSGHSSRSSHRSDDVDDEETFERLSVVSMPESALSSSTSMAEVESLMGDLSYSERSATPRRIPSSQSILDAVHNKKKHRRMVRGEKNFGQALAVLVEAEELELTDEEVQALQAEVYSQSPEGLAKGEAVVALACDLIGREQHRMFGRMATEYIHLVRGMTEALRRVVTPFLPDILARIVVQLLWICAPYARELLTRRARKVIKRKITYWMGGVETANIDDWENAVGVAMHQPSSQSDVHSYQTKRLESVTASPSASVVFSSSQRRGSTAGPDVCIPRPPLSASQSAVQKDGATPNATSSVFPSLAGSPAASVRLREPHQLFVSTRPALANEADSDSGGLQQHILAAVGPGSVAYRKALDDILDDFDKLRKSGAEGKFKLSTSAHQPSKPKQQPHQGGGKRKGGRPVDDDPKHLENHRHAPINRRAELWHEQGRNSTAAVNSESKARQGHFDTGNCSPFMKRYIKDHGMDGAGTRKQQTLSRLIRWTSS